MVQAPGACAIKDYELVVYGKLTNYVVSLWFFCYCRSLSLAWTNTLAYYGIRTLQIRSVDQDKKPGDDCHTKLLMNI